MSGRARWALFAGLPEEASTVEQVVAEIVERAYREGRRDGLAEAMSDIEPISEDEDWRLSRAYEEVEIS